MSAVRKELHPRRAEELGDAALVARVLDGEDEAYAELVRRHQGPLYGHARGMGLDRDTAEDLVQDAFVRAYTRLDTCRDRDRFGLWLFRIFRHRCLDHVKSPRRRTVPVEDVELHAERGLPERDALMSELRDDLARHLGELPHDLREAFLMKHHEGRSYDEMAEALDAAPGTLRMRVHRAREALRESLGAERPRAGGM